MNTARHIAEDELARDPARVFQNVLEGETVIVDQHGEPRAAIVDPFHLDTLLAVISYYVTRPRLNPEAGLDESQLVDLDAFSRIETVMAHYLAEAISLSRAAELLGKSWAELCERFSRIGVPIRTAPADEESARQDVLVAMATLSSSP